MTALDWSQCAAVESVPGKVSGDRVLRGTRTPVRVIFENLEAGMGVEEVVEQFPVTRAEFERLWRCGAFSGTGFGCCMKENDAHSVR